MATARQNIIERITDKIEKAEISVLDGNVELVRAERIRLVNARVPAQVRRALNAAVKTGLLGHVKKDGHKPECYFHPSFKHMAIAARNAAERDIYNAISKCSVFAQNETI